MRAPRRFLPTVRELSLSKRVACIAERAFSLADGCVPERDTGRNIGGCEVFAEAGSCRTPIRSRRPARTRQ